jgi:hypothetical protein
LGGKGYFGHWQTRARASCVFRALMRYEVKQQDFKVFEGDS